MRSGLILTFYHLALLAVKVLGRPLCLKLCRLGAAVLAVVPIHPMNRNIRVINRKRKQFGMEPVPFYKTRSLSLYYTLKNLVDFLYYLCAGKGGFSDLIEKPHQEHLKEVYSRGKGVAGVCMHLGNWELGAKVLYDLEITLSSLVFRQLDPALERIISDARRSVKVGLLHQRSGIKEAVAALNRGEMVTVLCDQDGTRNGHFQRFFDLYISFPRIFELILKKTDAVLLPMLLLHQENGHGYRVEIGEPMTASLENLDSFYESLARYLERQICQHPEQWLLLYDRFKFRHDSKLKELGIYDEILADYQAVWKGL